MSFELTPSWALGIDWTAAGTRRRAAAERFTLERPIGRGGYGEVWAARHAEPTHSRGSAPIAIKVLTPELARTASFVAAFRREVRSVARLRHDAIVRVLDVGVLGPEAEAATDGRLRAGSPFLAMERLQGPPLSACVGTALPFAALRDVLLHALDALAYAHAHDVLHLDVKPENLLGRRPDAAHPSGAQGGRFVLTDFGVAWSPGEGGRPAGGTPRYAAPELRTGRSVGPAADLYSLGCVAFELLTGAPPPAAGRAAAFEVAPDVPPHDGFPGAFAAWVRRMLAPGIADRFRDAASAARALAALAPHVTWRPSATAAREEALHDGLGLFRIAEPAFVGRDAERRRLDAAYQEASAGTPIWVEVVGREGEGRRRLLREFTAALRTEGDALVVTMREGESFSAALLRALGASDMGPRRIARALAVHGAPHGAPQRALLAHAHTLLETVDDPNPAADAGALRLLCERRCVVVLASGVERFAGVTFEGAKLLVLEARRAPHPTRGARVLPLEPLPASHRRQLLERLGVEGEAVRRALEPAGEPVGAMLERLRRWLRAGRLQREGERVLLRAAPAETELQVSSLEAGASEHELRALEVAAHALAVSEVGVELPVWRRACEGANTQPTLGSLDRVEELGAGRLDEGVLTLAPTTRAALLTRGRGRAARIHTALAQALDETPGRIRRRASRRALHLLAAGQDARAALIEGARARLRALDLRTAEHLLAQVPAADPPDAWSVEEALARATRARLGGDEAVATREAERAHHLARTLGLDEGEALLMRARVARWRGDTDLALRLVLQASGQTRDPHVRVRAILDQARVRLDVGDARSAARVRDQLTTLCAELPAGREDFREAVEAVSEASGRPAGAERRGVEPKPRERKSNVERTLAQLLRARACRLAHDLEGASAALDEAEAHARRATFWLLLQERAALAAAQGDDPRAIALYGTALERSTRLGDPEAPAIELKLGLAHGRVGELESALAHVDGALEAWRVRGDARAESWRVARAWLLALGGAHAAALEELRAASAGRSATWRVLTESLLSIEVPPELTSTWSTTLRALTAR